VREAQRFECMFCGQRIDSEPVQVMLQRQSETGHPDAQTASFWTHLTCLRERVHPPTAGYLVGWEPDLST